jgi:hypothetical protein
MFVNYKAYRIETFEEDPSQWRAIIRRLDGKPIKLIASPSEHDFLDTMLTVSEDQAIVLAKEGIDGGGMT